MTRFAFYGPGHSQLWHVWDHDQHDHDHHHHQTCVILENTLYFVCTTVAELFAVPIPCCLIQISALVSPAWPHFGLTSPQ